MTQLAPVAPEQTSPPVEIPKKTLSDLKIFLDGYIRTAGLACKGMVIGGLDLDQFDHVKAKPYFNPMRGCRVFYLGVGQELKGVKYSATLLIKEECGKPLLGTVLAKGKKIEVTVVSLEEGRDSKIMIHADLVRADGESDYEIANQLIKAECVRLGYYDRVKRSRPPFFIKVGIITSKAGGVESDIVKILTDSGMQLDLETDLRRCASAEEMTLVFKEMDAGGYDAICFFRGGREDPAMAIFRDQRLFKAIVMAQTYTVSGLCHEPDHPLIEGIVDEARNTPTAFGEMVSQHNASFIESIATLAKAAEVSYKNAIGKIDKDHSSRKQLSDSYFDNCISSIRESITDQCVGTYRSIVQSIMDQTRYQSRDAANSYLKSVQIIFNQARGNSGSCTQSFTNLVNAILADVKRTAQKAETAKISVKGKEERLVTETMLVEEHKRRINSERKNKQMICALTGVVAGIFIGLNAQSLFIGIGAALVVGGALSWFLLRKK